MLHHPVVAMGIDPDVAALLQAPGDAGLRNTLPFSGRGDPVNNPVRGIVEPRSIKDLKVSGLLAHPEIKCPDNSVIPVETNVTPFRSNIFQQELLFRVSIHPLSPIAGLHHETACGLIDLQQLRQIIDLCRTDPHLYFFVFLAAVFDPFLALPFGVSALVVPSIICRHCSSVNSSGFCDFGIL